MSVYTKDEIEKLVLTLVGGFIEPIGDSSIDAQCLENLSLLLELMQSLHMKIDRLAELYSDSNLASRRAVGLKCNEYLDWLGIPK